MLRHTLFVLTLLCSFTLPGRVSGQDTKQQQPASTYFTFTPKVLQEGFALLSNARLPILKFGVNFQWGTLKVEPIAQIGSDHETQLQRLSEQIKEASEAQAVVLQRQQELLKLLSEQIKAHNEYQKRLVDLHASSLDLQARRIRYEQGVLRKEKYDVPPDKLVVVVADFSSGEPARGREVADEIAAQITQLKKHGIDVHVLIGEVKPGVIIRSEELAQDVGKHLPAHTTYIVLWGTMSESTLGLFRPHVTCAYKRDEDSGVALNYSIDLTALPLPMGTTPVDAQREQYARLVGVCCAVVPKCYAAFQINRDHVPDLDGLVQFLGSKTEVADDLTREVAAVSHWAKVRKNHTNLRRLAAISDVAPYPDQVVNMVDDTLQVLIKDRNGKPVEFTDQAGKKYLAYMDVTEVSIANYARFLNEKGNLQDGGVQWYKENSPQENWKVIQKAEKFTPQPDTYKFAPIINVSYFGAEAYCKWAGKSLPHYDEWLKAATAVGDPYPWGKDWDPEACNSALAAKGAGREFGVRPGRFPKDRSHVGCLDMAGNVAEWCDDFHDQQKGERVIAGASWKDDKDEVQLQKKRHLPQVNHETWVGFRGVIRVYLVD